MKKFLMLIAVFSFLALPNFVLASDTIDMAKVSCKEFLEWKDSEIEDMIFWIDGYMSAKSDNTKMDQAWLEKLGKHIGEFCAKNPKKTIMQAMQAMPGD